MKKIAIIGACYLQLPLYLKAGEMGISTLGFAWEEGSVARDHCGKFFPISITEKEQILEQCRREQIDGILSIASDLAVLTVNYVAEHMGLPGNGIASSLISTNKFRMRHALQKAGLRGPPFFLINPGDDPEGLSGQIRYPVIIKPTDRSGSLGVSRICDPSGFVQAATDAMGKSFSGEAIVEGFVEGHEVSVEMISHEGVHYALAVTDKENSGPPDFVELAHHQPSSLPQHILERIYDKTRIGLDALNIRNGASHSEFIINDEGIHVIEIGARMGGDFIGSDLVYLSTGYDFLKGVIQSALGVFEPPCKSRHLCSGVYFYSAESKHVKKWVEKYGSNPAVVRADIKNEPLRPLKQSTDRSGYFIYQDHKKLVLKS